MEAATTHHRRRARNRADGIAAQQEGVIWIIDSPISCRNLIKPYVRATLPDFFCRTPSLEGAGLPQPTLARAGLMLEVKNKPEMARPG
jgi:hypothetical protein